MKLKTAKQPDNMNRATGKTVRSIAVAWIVAISGCATWQPAAPSSYPAYPAAQVETPRSLGAPATGTSATGTSATGTSATGTSATGTSATGVSATVRGQTPPPQANSPAPGTDDHLRYPMAVSGNPVSAATVTRAQGGSAFQPPGGQPPPGTAPPTVPLFPGGNGVAQPFSPFGAPEPLMSPADQFGAVPPAVDVDVFVEEARTGRFMFGAGVNSDLGLTGQIVVDERNFDWRRPPTSFQDIVNGTAWRGGGQGFRLEAMPGSQVQRYLASFTEPYFYLPGFVDPFSLSLSGFFYDRRFFDWDEQRLGGRVALGYRLTHDLSLTTAIRGENVNIHDPRVLTVPELNTVLGDNSLFSGRWTVTHDTRDLPFAATEGHLVELSYEQVFGSFDYPRADLDYRQYFLMRERPDGSGRHTLSYSFRLGFSGSQTPIFENYFAGGYSTLRGFDFRGASPVQGPGIVVGGEFRFLGTVEYMFPLTADDMIKGVVFCDYGTVERNIELNSNNYRVAPGVGLRISIPALGPAPLALDLAFPVAHAATDDIQNFSFFFGFGR